MSTYAPQTTLRIGRALVTPLCPYEAAIRCQLLLHQLATDCIHACAGLYARYGAAIAEVHSHLLVVECDRR